MPKKTATARGAAPRTRKAQKSFELIRPEGADQQEETPVENTSTEKASHQATTATITPTEATPETVNETNTSTEAVSEAPIVSKNMSASARLAARRKASQRAQQRQAASLITTEHFSYVRRDLTIIASLAVIMFAAIIILYFVLI